MLCKGRGYWILPLLILSFIFPGIVSEISFARAQDNPSFLTYTNTNLGFTFKYPPDWKVYEYEVESGGVITLESPDKVGSVLASVDTLKPNETGITLQQYLKTYLQKQKFAASNIHLLEVNTNSYALSGHPAVRIIEIETLNYGDPGYPLKDTKSMSLFTLLGNHLYIIHYDASPSDKFPNYLQQAQDLIDSFQIISKQ
jgi:hypothetical protein